jgi:hypothetical protein
MLGNRSHARWVLAAKQLGPNRGGEPEQVQYLGDSGTGNSFESGNGRPGGEDLGLQK